jgi:lysozyme family protein
MSAYARAFAATMKNEGGYANVQGDKGGETYMGISRVYWPTWPGWVIIDDWRAGHLNGLAAESTLAGHVSFFYRVQFWDRLQGDAVAEISEAVAIELFDTAVNMGVYRSVCFLQTALNMQNQFAATYPDIQVDGKIGKSTLNTLRRYLASQPGSVADNELILLNCMNGEQYLMYKSNAQHERFRGWFRRV